ncbi:ABA4-like family protein [Rhizobium sp. NRK18]|uniref:ABA4-like family protein n=1 Tax=Rhizobium sp. NRK18 TaxID=2964667 RepID=UPI0021C48C26|nr:ABA4-like family protein [Rhizobium sp. NRK18]MCQ2004666.1 ABA4-like family protein [Rhizobium sp. NRK18]
MSFDMVFSAASTLAMCGWLALVLLPRWPALIAFLRYAVIGILALAYATLILVYFFRIQGGGFGSIAEVRTLFSSDAILLAGWIHYLAFDLFIGTWIALEADKHGTNRILQAPILIATFLFGPLGLLIFYVTRAADMALSKRKA